MPARLARWLRRTDCERGRRELQASRRSRKPQLDFVWLRTEGAHVAAGIHQARGAAVLDERVDCAVDREPLGDPAEVQQSRARRDADRRGLDELQIADTGGDRKSTRLN